MPYRHSLDGEEASRTSFARSLSLNEGQDFELAVFEQEGGKLAERTRDGSVIDYGRLTDLRWYVQSIDTSRLLSEQVGEGGRMLRFPL